MSKKSEKDTKSIQMNTFTASSKNNDDDIVEMLKIKEATDSIYDYLELIETATSKKKKLEYIETALKIESENLDVLSMKAELTSKSPIDFLAELEKLIDIGHKQIRKAGYFSKEYEGEFWLVFETRPFMRLKHMYMRTLLECGMMRKAAAECEDMLHLCENDNLGVRFYLMHIYAFLEDEKAALSLYERYNEYGSTQIFLPLAVLYYKLGRFDESIEYLDKLNFANKDLKRFLTAITRGSTDELIDELGPYGYRPGTVEELMVELMEYGFLFESAPYFFTWAKKQVKK